MELAIELTPLHLHILQCAAMAAYRFDRANLLTLRESRHCQITRDIPDWSTLTANSDYMLPVINTEFHYRISFPQRTDYLTPSFLPPDEPNDWFTDGSKTNLGCGSGIYNLRKEYFIALEDTASVFQADLHAITTCAGQILEYGTTGKNIRIFSDSP